MGIFRINNKGGKKEIDEYKKLQILSALEIPIKDLDTLDKIITDIFTQYRILNLEFRDNEYITIKKQEEIVKDVFTVVYNSISPTFLEKLNIIYQENHIDDMIAQKIQMIVISYASEVNGSYNKK